jgi:pSer/pThr/pTyr-binding forkhead associated (FHA) protein
LSVFAAVLSQTQPSLEVSNIDTREFPLIRAEVKPRHLPDPAVDQLDETTMQILEDENILPVRSVVENYEGFHLALAINPGLSLGWRDVNGISRYDKLIQAFIQLNQSLIPGSGDRFSLYINPDYEQTGFTDLDSLLIALADYPGNMRQMQSSIISLQHALEALSLDESDQDKTLLYITVLPLLGEDVLLDEMLQTALDHHITINIWLSENPEVGTYPQIPHLRALAEGSGGNLFLFSSSEPIPDPTSYILGLGKRYQVSYLSQLRTSGEHELALNLQTSAGVVTSPNVTFSVEVLPAEVEFINLPETISVQTAADGSLSPAELPVEITVSFPDSHPRSITKASLWINGNRYQENSFAPYFNFRVDLADFPESQHLSLQAKISDELGLTGQSALTSLSLEVLPVPSSPSSAFWRNPWLLGLLGALLVGILTFIVLPARRKGKRLASKVPTPEEGEQPLSSAQKILATLTRLDSDNTPLPEKPIPITQELTIIGRDPELCQLSFADPALEPMHCQLRMLPERKFRLTDFHSKAGTWVNYAPVGQSGLILQQGDIVHIGSITFRFGSGSGIASNVRGNTEESTEPTEKGTAGPDSLFS